MSKVVNDDCLNVILREARTHNVWLKQPVDDALLKKIYDLAKWALPPPTCVHSGSYS